MRKLLDKTGKGRKKRRKEKRKITNHMIRQKKGEICALCRSFLATLNESCQSWFKVLTARRAVNEGAQFSENVYGDHLWNMI